MRTGIRDKAILRSYLRLNNKLNDVEKLLNSVLNIITTPVKLTQNEHLMLRSLPNHLIRTYFILQELGSARANQIALITGKARAIESHYLCQLTTMGYVTKKRLPHQKYVTYTTKKPEPIP
jgi:hypothetical protein